MITVGAMALEESIPDRPDLGRITLREETGERSLPIMMLKSQLAAIAEADRDIGVPMTHDLLRSLIETLSGRLVAVVITDLRGGTFHAAWCRRVDLPVMWSAAREPSDPSSLVIGTELLHTYRHCRDVNEDLLKPGT